MRRISKKHIVISLPNSFPVWKIQFTLPIIGTKSKLIKNIRWKRKPAKFDGTHYWELENSDYTIEKFIKILNENGLSVFSNFRLFENPYHHFFLLKKC